MVHVMLAIIGYCCHCHDVHIAGSGVEVQNLHRDVVPILIVLVQSSFEFKVKCSQKVKILHISRISVATVATDVFWKN